VFSAANARVAEVLPPDAPARTFTPKAFAETIVAWAPTAAREVAASDVRAADGPAAVPEGAERHRQPEREDAVVLPVPLAVRDFSTLNGPKAFVREDQSRSLISIGFFYAGGRAAEAAGDRGITELMLRSMVRGSRKYPGDKLVQALEQLGAEVRVVSDIDFFGLVVEAPSRNAEQVFPIAIDMVARPAFEKETVARERDVLLAAQRLARADAAERSVELFWQSRYPTHAYGAAALGQPETVAKLDDEKVRDWYARTAGTTFPLVAIVGDTDGSSLISRFVAEGFDRGEGTPAPTPGLPAPAAAGEASEPHDRAGTTQTLGFPVQGGAAAALDALDVAIAAAGARALAELGDRLGIATVRATVERRRLAGAARVTAASSTADETRVRDAVAAKLSEVAGASLSDAELGAARGLAITSTLDARQAFTDMLVVYVCSAALGAPLDTVENYAERSSAITAESVRKAAAAFNPQLAGRGVARGR
jgi:zinc protease